MQVERQPSPWPSVVMLVGLLLFCLTVPRYWRLPTPSGAAAPTAPTPAVSANGTLPYLPVDFGGSYGALMYGATHTYHTAGISRSISENELLNLWPVPSIDELIAARMAIHQPPVTIEWPTIEPIAETRDETAIQVGVESFMSNTFAGVGRAIIAYAPAELLPRMTQQAARVYQLWTTEALRTNPDANRTANSRVRIVSPGDRLAMIPKDGDRAPRMVPANDAVEMELENDPWCVPEILLEQLQRIADFPQSREWAETTIAQLQELSYRKSFVGDDVQTVLAGLCDLAQQAMSLAETTDDDRLRVEILRAHWGLARRLDRWAVVHDIRVAAISGERFAARDSLGTFFDGAPTPSTSADRITVALESYERSRDPEIARRIVAEKRSLEASDDSLDRALADSVEQHYRNANVRVAISAEMLNRYVGQERTEVRPLRDRINGASIRGQSHLQSTSRVQLEPAEGAWDLDIESEGTIRSNAMADGGQARFRSQTNAEFSAEKRVVVDSTGVVMQPASIDVDSTNRLAGVTTDLDWVPFVRLYARDRAMREYRIRQSRAKSEVESRVASEAAGTLDRETQEAVARIEKQIRDNVTDRLSAYGVKATPIELRTTDQRVVARLRIASDDQPGSHTPRPRALSDSLASAQIHESALSNAAVSLELDGRKYTATELAELFRNKLPRSGDRKIEEKRRDAIFQFADHDAVKFLIEDGRLEVIVSMACLELDGRKMRNFIVHALYAPKVDGLEAELVRDGSLGIEGRLSSADRARLHNVFNEILPADRPMPLVRFEDKNDKRLTGLMITQLVLEDGWLGVAIGPATTERVAERSRSLR
jgi:hypothetical protein